MTENPRTGDEAEDPGRGWWQTSEDAVPGEARERRYDDPDDRALIYGPERPPPDAGTQRASDAGAQRAAPIGEPVRAPVGEPVRAPVGEPVRVPVGESVRLPVGDPAPNGTAPTAAGGPRPSQIGSHAAAERSPVGDTASQPGPQPAGPPPAGSTAPQAGPRAAEQPASPTRKVLVDEPRPSIPEPRVAVEYARDEFGLPITRPGVPPLGTPPPRRRPGGVPGFGWSTALPRDRLIVGMAALFLVVSVLLGVLLVRGQGDEDTSRSEMSVAQQDAERLRQSASDAEKQRDAAVKERDAARRDAATVRKQLADAQAKQRATVTQNAVMSRCLSLVVDYTVAVTAGDTVKAEQLLAQLRGPCSQARDLVK